MFRDLNRLSLSRRHGSIIIIIIIVSRARANPTQTSIIIIENFPACLAFLWYDYEFVSFPSITVVIHSPVSFMSYFLHVDFQVNVVLLIVFFGIRYIFLVFAFVVLGFCFAFHISHCSFQGLKDLRNELCDSINRMTIIRYFVVVCCMLGIIIFTFTDAQCSFIIVTFERIFNAINGITNVYRIRFFIAT